MVIRRVATRRRPQIALQALMGSGLIAAAIIFAVNRLEQEAPAPKATSTPIIVPEFDMVSLPVPESIVAAGTKVKEIQLRMVAFPKHQVPPNALTSLASYMESAAAAPLPANLPLFPENFSLSAVKGNPVIDQVPAGMRAITISVDATTAVEGWAGSGTTVDVLLVEKDKASVIAEKVRVLSADRSTLPIEGQSAPNVPTTVTLLVSQEQCLAINTAIPRGRLAFALRSANDTESWSDPVYSASRLAGAPSVEVSHAKISGYVSVKDGSGFSLLDGKWVRSDTKPSGFFVAGN